jgi:hypothetical protein
MVVGWIESKSVSSGDLSTNTKEIVKGYLEECDEE